MKTIAAVLAGLALLWPADRTCAQGTVNWNESVNGPLSNDVFSPTSLGQPLCVGRAVVDASRR